MRAVMKGHVKKNNKKRSLQKAKAKTGAAQKAILDALKEEKDDLMLLSVLNDALKSLSDAEKRGEKHATICPSYQVIIRFLTVMQRRNYIEEFEDVDDLMFGKIVVDLNGRVNECGVISPRVDVGVDGIDDLVANLLPSRKLGYVVLATSAGFMDHEAAKRENVGGKVIGFFY